MHYAPGYPSKKTLKEALKAGTNVRFVDTSIYKPENFDSKTMPVGTRIYLVGPSPTERNWYAQIDCKSAGAVTIK